MLKKLELLHRAYRHEYNTIELLHRAYRHEYNTIELLETDLNELTTGIKRTMTNP